MNSRLRIALFFCLSSLLTGAAFAQDSLVVGANVNMVSGGTFPDGDPFQRQQNEPSVAFSSRNSLHLLAGANDYRAVDVPGLPGGRETGDSWLSYFWSTNGGATWKSTLIPGYPQDPACQTANAPTLCGYAAGADPVVRAGVNGMFYYSGIVFERADPSRSAIFVSRFIDLNNDEGGDPIRYLDTVIIDANNDGAVFLDKSWIGVDIPRGTVTDTFPVVQSNGTEVDQTVACGNIYVGYAAIEGEDDNLRSEIRMATSADCGNAWDIQVISDPDTLNQGANIAIQPLTGEMHVVWRRFDTVESFLGISPTGCPASPASWKINSDWPVSTIQLGGVSYTVAQAQALLGRKHRGDESIKLAYEVIAAKLNLLTGGGDPVPGFNPWEWAQELTGLIAEADAWFADNPVDSDPKKDLKKDGQTIKKNIQRILQGSGTCSDNGTATTASTTGDSNAIMAVSSDDFGQTFSAPTVINESTTFDQGSTRFSFRTTAYPTVAADADGRIYVAWAARGFATIRGDLAEGDARIVISTSVGGTSWTPPYAIDEPNRNGHQIKPSMLFAGGQLTLVYYDFRQDVSNIFEGFVIDLPEGDRLRHTVDVRVATALPAVSPIFTDNSLLDPTDPSSAVNPSGSASRYAFISYADPGASPGAPTGETLQVEYMVPNFPMFADGTTPFIGDYVDVAAPNLINDGGTWRFASNPGDVQVWQAVWSDNRDVVPPPDGDWSKYVAPIVDAQASLFDPTVIIPSCYDVSFPDSDYPSGSLYTGTRNQNVYSASLSKGIIVAAPGNNRPLSFDVQRGFVVYVQNATAQTRTFRLALPEPATLIGIEASFAPGQVVPTKVIEIPPYSSSVATVYARSNGAASDAIPISVTELGGTLTGSVLLNSDASAPGPLDASLGASEVHNPAILNPAILNPAVLNASVGGTDFMACTSDDQKCVLTPAVLNPAVLNPAVFNPAVLNPAVLNPAVLNPAVLNPAVFNPAVFNPAVLNPAVMNPAVLNPAILNPAVFNPAIFNPAVLNPAVLNPAVLNPAVLNPAVLNPAVLNPAIFNPAVLNPAVFNPAILNPAILNSTPTSEPQPRQVDVTFTVRNDGNATTAYDLNLAAPQLEGLDYDLVVYRLNETPVAQGCELISEAQQQLVFNQKDPLNTAVDGSFYLEPGQEVLVTFRVLPDVEAETSLDPATNFNSADLGGLVSAQPPNTDPATQPPADEFGPPANIVLGTAGGTTNGGGGTPPLNAGPLAAGQQVSVTATGFVQRAVGAALDSPNGSTACDSSCLTATAPGLSLVARIGGGPWQFVGTGPTVLTASIAGDLEFAVNDNLFNDNSGAFYVSVSPVTSCDIAGDWSGPYIQGAFAYPVVVTNLSCGTPGSVIAEVEYPTLPCSGTWTLDGIVGDTLLITETVTGAACVPVVAHEVTLDGGTLNGVTPGYSATFSILPTITSNFAIDADGWTIANDGGGRVATGGNPGGYLEGSDSGGATGSTAWYFDAPAKFLGNQSTVYGGELRYDLQQSDNAPTISTLPWVVLRGAGVTLVYDAGIGALPGSSWTSFLIPLSAADPGWHIAPEGCWTFAINTPEVCNFSGAAPTVAQFVSVLSSLDTLLIRGEYSLTLDTGGLDNVVLDTPRFTVTSFDPSVVFSGTSPAQQAALDAAVGVTGYTIEDFEDLSFVPGLTVSGGVFGQSINSAWPNAIWDGSSTYLDQALTGSGVIFGIAGGTSSFGIGLSDIDVADVNLFVNGQDLGSIMALPNWRKLGDNVRDVYVRVDAAPGEIITSVRIEQGTASTFNDGIFFDHVAFDPGAAPPPPTGVTITSVSPDPGGVDEGFIVARGANLPPPMGSVAVVTNGTTTSNGSVFLSPSTTTAYWVRLPLGFPPGPATIQIQNGAASSNAFPITVSATPGTPIITNVFDAGFNVTSSVSAGSTINIQADGIDTLGSVARFQQGATITDVASFNATSNSTIGLTTQFVAPAGLLTGPVTLSIRQGTSAFSAPVTLTVPVP